MEHGSCGSTTHLSHTRMPSTGDHREPAASRHRALIVTATLIALAAWGGARDDAAPEVADPPVATTVPAAGPAPVVVTAKETALGTALVGPDGLTLYAFTNDIDASAHVP